jgi:hypothetical protein
MGLAHQGQVPKTIPSAVTIALSGHAPNWNPSLGQSTKFLMNSWASRLLLAGTLKYRGR